MAFWTAYCASCLEILSRLRPAASCNGDPVRQGTQKYDCYDWLMQEDIVADCMPRSANGTTMCYVSNSTMEQCMPGNYESGAALLGEQHKSVSGLA